MIKSPIKFITIKNVCRPVPRNIPALIVLLIFDTLVISYVCTMYMNNNVEKDFIFPDFWIIVFFTKRIMEKKQPCKGRSKYLINFIKFINCQRGKDRENKAKHHWNDNLKNMVVCKDGIKFDFIVALP